MDPATAVGLIGTLVGTMISMVGLYFSFHFYTEAKRTEASVSRMLGAIEAKVDSSEKTYLRTEGDIKRVLEDTLPRLLEITGRPNTGGQLKIDGGTPAAYSQEPTTAQENGRNDHETVEREAGRLLESVLEVVGLTETDQHILRALYLEGAPITLTRLQDLLDFIPDLSESNLVPMNLLGLLEAKLIGQDIVLSITKSGIDVAESTVRVQTIKATGQKIERLTEQATSIRIHKGGGGGVPFSGRSTVMYQSE